MEIDALGRGLPVLGMEPASRTVEAVVPRSLVTAVQAANRVELFGEDRELSFSRDNESRRMKIQVKDRNTGEILQEIPPKELLEMLANLPDLETPRPNR